MNNERDALDTRPLHPTFGVEVSGVDLSQVTKRQLFPQIRAAFEEHSALLFRDQSLTSEAHLALASLFGPIEDPKANQRKEGEPTMAHRQYIFASSGSGQHPYRSHRFVEGR